MSVETLRTARKADGEDVELFILFKSVCMLTQHQAKFLDIFIFCLFFRHDGLAERNMNLLAGLFEEFARETQSAEAPVDHAEDIEEGGIMLVEIHRHDRHLKLSDESEQRGLPFAVGNMQSFIDLRDSAGGEETHRMTISNMSDGLAHTEHGGGALSLIATTHGIYGDKRWAHRREVVEEHIYHHLEIGAMTPDDVKEEYTIQGSEGVIADSDKRLSFEAIEHLLVVYTLLNAEGIFNQEVGEGNTGGIAISAMHIVTLVKPQEAHQFLRQKGKTIDWRYHALNILESKYFRSDTFRADPRVIRFSYIS